LAKRKGADNMLAG